MNETDLMLALQTDPLFVNSKRFGYDINNVETKYPEGCPDHVISDLLMISEDEIEEEMDKIVAKLRVKMKVDLS